MNFVAIDFETADRSLDSACAVALVKVDDWQITERGYWLIRPPREKFRFTHIHGISWRHVADQLTFAELWPDMLAFVGQASFMAAHNADFDRSVLRACCELARISLPRWRFRCSAKLARRVLKIYPANLRAVCDRLGIPLKHHDARSDAEACARIMIAAQGRTHRKSAARAKPHPVAAIPEATTGIIQREFPGW